MSYYLTTCGIVRDELDLPEWVAYQFAVGVDHVHLYDNESIVPVAETLRDWIRDGKVSVESARGIKMQSTVYSDFLANADTKWVAFIDADEYLLPHDTDDLKELLRGYEEYGGLAVSWQVFGPNGHGARPNGLVIESYLRKGIGPFDLYDHPSGRPPTCWQYKCIVQTKCVKRALSPHSFEFKKRFLVNERGEEVRGLLRRPFVERIQLNHYITKSAEDWRMKEMRRGAHQFRARTEDEWRLYEKECALEDTRILRFVPAVKKLMSGKTRAARKKGVYLAACAIVKDEPDISEWVAYQIAVGVEHVRIYDNGSAVPVAKILRNWIADGKVSVEMAPGRDQQFRCYRHFMGEGRSRWVAFLDADEFPLCDQDDLKRYVAAYEQYGGLALAWRVFGSNGHVERPKGLVIESYDKTSEGLINTKPGSAEFWPLYKTIAQPEYVIDCQNSHYMLYRTGKHAVNEKGVRMPPYQRGPVTADSIQMNHYMLKSEEDWRLKVSRGRLRIDTPRKTEERNYLETLCNTAVDTRIQRFVPTVRALMEEYHV
jgi:hypothetical protein